LRLSDFDFELPSELIAQEPLEQRDRSRLMSVDLRTGALAHHRVGDLPGLLQPADLVVANNSRVFPARLRGQTEGGASIEILLLRSVEENHWEVLARPGKRLRKGAEIQFAGGLIRARVVGSTEHGKRIVEISSQGDLHEMVERIGYTPLPPYIQRDTDALESLDRDRYQTVYARERGSIAAPTAGLHFTEKLLQSLRERGIGFVELTLHVGYGTFQPIRTETVEGHNMEAERFRIPQETAQAIEHTRARGGRVVAVGTTTVRALESAAQEGGKVQAGQGSTDLFIYPGFRFRVVEALLTNLHLPKSSLLLLVSAFAGVDLVRRAYREAVQARYRFYSYGDCMLIRRSGDDSNSRRDV
jgi:S-adenosylmethionine:tRNA ribosyltransferase-isomerase